jgi:hypothetical protein
MDKAQTGDTVLREPGNVFYFFADLAAATVWYSARIGDRRRS